MAELLIRERQFDYGPQRESWTSIVKVSTLLTAATDRFDYHQRRHAVWKRRYSIASGKERRSMKAKEVAVTGGMQTIYEADPAAVQAKHLAAGKVAEHFKQMAVYREWVSFLSVGAATSYMLTHADAEFFALSGHQPDEQ
jgi:hypothetical protein